MIPRIIVYNSIHIMLHYNWLSELGLYETGNFLMIGNRTDMNGFIVGFNGEVNEYITKTI